MADDAAIRKDVNHRRHDSLFDGAVEMRGKRNDLGFTAWSPAVQQVNDRVSPFLAGRIVVTGRQVNAVADIDLVRVTVELAVAEAGELALGERVDPFERRLLLVVLGNR